MATNIDIVRTGYESYCRGDIQTTLAMFTENIAFHERETGSAEPSCSLRGRREVLRLVFTPVPELDDTFALQSLRFSADGDVVHVTGVFHLARKGGMAAVAVPFAHDWTVHRGRIDGLLSCGDVREAFTSRPLRDAA